tara:strand:+ start:57 stop:488 length:432 start_codon:yes stop_codon:yes gene_type:complete
MSKKKRKLRKLIKGLGMGAALLGAGKALMNRKDKANQMKEFLATEGGARSILPKAKRFVNVQGKMAFPVDVDALPFEISQKVKDYGFNTNRKDLGVPAPRFNPTMMLDSGLAEGDFAAKDGGRARKSKFSKKKKKQANRSRKK